MKNKRFFAIISLLLALATAFGCAKTPEKEVSQSEGTVEFESVSPAPEETAENIGGLEMENEAEATPEVSVEIPEETPPLTGAGSVLSLIGEASADISQEDTAELLPYIENADPIEYPFLFTPLYEVTIGENTYEIMPEKWLHEEDGYEVAILSDGAELYEADADILTKLEILCPVEADYNTFVENLFIKAGGIDEAAAIDMLMEEIVPEFLRGKQGETLTFSIDAYEQNFPKEEPLLYSSSIWDLVYTADNGTTSISGEETRLLSFVINDPVGTRIYLIGTAPIEGNAEKQLTDAAAKLSIDLLTVG